MCNFSLRSQNSEYPRIFQVTGANQNARKLLSTDLVNTKTKYLIITREPTCYGHDTNSLAVDKVKLHQIRLGHRECYSLSSMGHLQDEWKDTLLIELTSNLTYKNLKHRTYTYICFIL